MSANGVAANPEGVRLAGKSKGWPHWTTPQNVIDVVREVNEIAVDPCSNTEAIPGLAKVNWYRGALDTEWDVLHSGLIFVNPPYNEAKAFVEKCVRESQRGKEIILLVAARTDTKWAHSIFVSARALCFWGPGRIRFGNPPPDSAGDAPSIPSMFAYWGAQPGKFMMAFGKHGVCFDLNRQRWSFPVTVRP